MREMKALVGFACAFFPPELLYCRHRITVALHRLGLKLFHAFHVCGTRYFSTLKPSPNLKKIFNKFRSSALSQATGNNL